jgi:hypothetical protein
MMNEYSVDMAYKYAMLNDAQFAAAVMEIIAAHKEGKASDSVIEWLYVVAKTRQRLINDSKTAHSN